ncbi:MAG TPA: HipA domain-containing protein [Bacteroidales bacterium]|nr:HipA domain-containing protein [Bacteroidales bacterium]
MEARSSNKDIFVYAHWTGMKEPVLMGVLNAEFTRGKEIFSFSYSEDWLKSSYSQILDPELQLYTGSQYAKDEKQNFGVFLDSSPDRWGRVLMKRREAAMARSDKRIERTLRESDYLLGVFDGHRMGAIRFKEDPNGPFLNDNKTLAYPPWTSIRELEQISLKLEDDNANEDPEYLKWLNILINPGSSLGGARPKASVFDEKNNLWIAKFPSKSDIKDIGGWEMVTNELARNAGLNVAESRIQKFSSKYYTFLTKRFDRSDTGERIHFASAMTMLGYVDGNNFQDGVSYLEMVDFLTQYGAKVESDLRELWQRIVFSILVSNTDDHLRNHGFMLTEKGWILSPAFDINPNEDGVGLSLNISIDDNSLDLDLALEVAEYFRLTDEEAIRIIEVIRRSVKSWRSIANKYQLPRSEQELMYKVFDKFL